MTRDKYPLYALAIVAVGAGAIWAGLPPALLLLFLVCPLMMFFMMRGMGDGPERRDVETNHDEEQLSRPVDGRVTRLLDR